MKLITKLLIKKYDVELYQHYYNEIMRGIEHGTILIRLHIPSANFSTQDQVRAFSFSQHSKRFRRNY